MAKYRDIADDLRRRIAAGEYPLGSRLPGVVALQQRYDAALGTVRAAQDILRDEGVLRTAQGEGSFVVALPEPEPADVLGRLRVAQSAISAAIDALESEAASGRRPGAQRAAGQSSDPR